MKFEEQFSQEKSWRIQRAAIDLVFEVLQDPRARKFLSSNDNAAYAASIIEHAIDFLEGTVISDDAIKALKMQLNKKQISTLIARLAAVKKRL